MLAPLLLNIQFFITLSLHLLLMKRINFKHQYQKTIALSCRTSFCRSIINVNNYCYFCIQKIEVRVLKNTKNQTHKGMSYEIQHREAFTGGRNRRKQTWLLLYDYQCFPLSIGSKLQEVSFCFSVFTTSGPVVTVYGTNTPLDLTWPKQDSLFHLLAYIQVFPCQKWYHYSSSQFLLFTCLIADGKKKLVVIFSFIYFLHLILCISLSTIQCSDKIHLGFHQFLPCHYNPSPS